MRSRAHDLAAGGGHAQYGQTALIWPIGPETEDPVDPCESRCIGQDLLAEALQPLCLHERRDQRDRILGKRCRAHRILPVSSAIAAREIAETG